MRLNIPAAPSPLAAQELMEAIQSGGDTDEIMGQTDCEEGCMVEADGLCPHGYLSAGRSAGII
jgi:hypothetical protein